jgi:hypothetical protein
MYSKTAQLVKPKKAKKTIGNTKQKAWVAFSRYMRTLGCLKSSGNKENGQCYTCDTWHDIKDLQAGHFIGGRKGAVLFDEELIRNQCMACNVFLHGNYSEYTVRMIAEVGMKKVREFMARKGLVKKYSRQDYIEIEETYKQKLKEL